MKTDVAAKRRGRLGVGRIVVMNVQAGYLRKALQHDPSVRIILPIKKGYVLQVLYMLAYGELRNPQRGAAVGDEFDGFFAARLFVHLRKVLYRAGRAVVELPARDAAGFGANGHRRVLRRPGPGGSGCRFFYRKMLRRGGRPDVLAGQAVVPRRIGGDFVIPWPVLFACRRLECFLLPLLIHFQGVDQWAALHYNSLGIPCTYAYLHG